MDDPREPEDRASDFASQAERPSPGVLGESMEWLAANKKWWLVPIVVALLVVVLLLAFAGGSIGPFLYDLF